MVLKVVTKEAKKEKSALKTVSGKLVFKLHAQLRRCKKI